jgi:hypothetical protein
MKQDITTNHATIKNKETFFQVYLMEREKGRDTFL